jgi:triacylglycerol lipase
MGPRNGSARKPYEAAPLPIWQELMIGVELAYLRVSPVYWGLGIPHGNGEPVVVVPGFLGTDFYLTEFRAWLRRIGYKTYDSGIGINADCPNLLIRYRLTASVEKAYKAEKKKVHVIGHSLGGVLARAAAAQISDKIASVITLSAPFQGVVAHPGVLRVAQLVRDQILERHGNGVLPACYTASCTCRFLESLKAKLPKGLSQTAIYTKSDGIVDWKVCKTGNRAMDFEVPGTHIGMVFNPMVFSIVAHRLAGQRPPEFE